MITQETGITWTSERWLERWDQPGGEDAPRPTATMEALVKVVTQVHKQWGIDYKPKDFILAVTRLMQVGAINHPVDLLQPEVWRKCTDALAEDTMSSGSGKSLKSWGRFVYALRKALQEQETWKAVQMCLRITPKLGVGAATQAADCDLTESLPSQEQACSIPSPSPDTPMGPEQARSP